MEENQQIINLNGWEVKKFPKVDQLDPLKRKNFPKVIANLTQNNLKNFKSTSTSGFFSSFWIFYPESRPFKEKKLHQVVHFPRGVFVLNLETIYFGDQSFYLFQTIKVNRFFETTDTSDKIDSTKKTDRIPRIPLDYWFLFRNPDS